MMSRRALLASAAAAASVSAKPRPFRLAVCSETFPGLPFEKICEAAKRTGYSGLEIDPSNLGEDPAALSSGERASLRAAMKNNGIAYCGLHSFLKAPKGLHLTTPDAAVRKRTWEYVDRLVDLAGDLGTGAVMVMGSGRQRQAIDGVSATDAVSRIVEGLAGVAPHAAKRGVTILVEPLAPHLCNVINTMAEAVAVVERVASPAVQSMFDTHNTTAEKDPLPEVIKRYRDRIRHVHLNELDGKYPGSGNFAFAPVLQALRDIDYRGWVSVEVFDFKPDGETVARLSAEFVRGIEARLR